MMVGTKKRVLAISAGGGAVVLTGTIAFAFWSSLGTGSGAASVGTDAGVTVSQSNVVAGLVPGGAAQPIDFTVTNTSTSAAVSITSVVIGFGSFPSGCSVADFTLVQPTKPSVVVPVAIEPSASSAFTSGGSGATGATGASIAMRNTSVNQDACKLATVTLTYAVG